MSEALDATQDTLAKIAPFASLSPATRAKIVSMASPRSLQRGEVLIREGEQGDSLFVVLSGRLRAYVHGQGDTSITVGEISAGEAVGEMAVLSDQPRTASVCAIRPSQLLEINRAHFEQLIEEEPKAFSIVTRTLVERLGRSIHGIEGTGNVKTIALIPAGGTRDVRAFTQDLAQALEVFGSVETADIGNTPGDLDSLEATTRWIEELENVNDKVLLPAGHESPEWVRHCLDIADRIVLIGSPTASPELNRFERDLLDGLDHRPSARIDFVMAHDSQRMPRNTGQWLANRPGLKCFNLRNGTSAGYPRFARVLAGTSNTLVLSGGGARGLAHIGVIRALEESGIVVDAVAGASFGAVIGAHLASGRGWEESRDITVRTLVDLGSPLDLTPPMIALTRGAKVRHQLREAFGDAEIEDLWLNYFCVSSNLSQGEVQVHQTGPVWQALRASIAIPGIFPPMRAPNGDVLVDGAVMNNLPVDIALELGEPGSMMAVNLRGPVDLAAHDLPHDGEVSGWRALRQRARRRRSAVPGIMETLLRASEIGSVVSSRRFEGLADLVFRPPVSKFAMMDFSAHDDLIEVGYRHAIEVLEHKSPSAVVSSPDRQMWGDTT
jgi:predicted acylesterase/phospholipase RssA/CRP-like cAMP-binding protein